MPGGRRVPPGVRARRKAIVNDAPTSLTLPPNPRAQRANHCGEGAARLPFRQRLLPQSDRAAPLVCLALVLLTLVAYRSAGELGFLLYDDGDYVTENPHVCSGLNWDDVAWAMTATYAANWHPLTWLSLQLDHQLFGGRAYGFHATNVLLHALAAVLLFLLGRSMTGALWRSGLAAALFAVHPQHVESVAWVAERKDVLSAVFWMTTLLAYVRYTRRPSWRSYAWVTASLALGLMAKPMLVTLPIIFLLLDFWPLERLRAAEPGKPAGAVRSDFARLLIEKFPWFALAAAATVVTIYAQKHGGAVASLHSVPLGFRLQNALVSVGLYVQKTFWPVELAILYPLSLNGIPPWKTVAAFLFVASVSSVTWRERGRRPYLLSGWMWFLISLAPVLGLVQAGQQAMADRYSYLPSVGLCVMSIWSLGQWATTRWRRGIAAAAAVASLLSCVALTQAQLHYWINGVALWEHSLVVTGPNPVAHFFLGGELLAAGRVDEAARRFEQAIAENPLYADAYRHLGIAQRGLGRWQAAETSLRRALALKPGDARAHDDLGCLLMKQGRLAEAQAEFVRAVELEPRWAAAWAHRAESLKRAGRRQEALASWRAAVQLAPGNVIYRLGLGLTLEEAGLLRESACQFAEADRLYCDWPDSACATAWSLATSPRADQRDAFQALEHARQACRGAFARRADCLDVLAAAHANAGEFDRALAVAAQAVSRAKTSGQAALAQQIEQRIALYRNNQPYREPNGEESF